MSMPPVAAAADGLELPRVQAGSSPQHLLLTLLGDYWYGQRAELSSAALVALLKEFGITQVSARAAMSRLARRGLLEVAKVGRRSSYALSGRAAEVLRDGLGRILSFATVDRPWSGQWTLAAFSVPEEHRDLRHSLRTRLGWLGFAPLYDGLWVCPHDRAMQARDILTALGIGTATVFSAELAAGSPIGGDPIQAWDLTALQVRYEELRARYEPVRTRLRAGQVGPAEALVARTAFMDEWRSLPSLDPELPSVLLPPSCARGVVRDLFIELYDGLAGPAERRVVQVVGAFDAELARLVRSHTTEFTG